MDLLFFIGIIIILGFVCGKIISQFKFPSVVGYLFVGLFLGPSFFNILSLDFIVHLDTFNELALSLVAFVIGSEMHFNVLKKLGKGIIAIIFLESFCAFFLVFLGVYLFTHKLHLALIFGAMAPASAPAGTAVVLQEYKAKGPLTNALYTVVGLDDGLAIMIYAIAACLAKISITGTTESILHVLKVPCLEIMGSIVLGGLFGLISGFIMSKIKNRNEILAFCLGAVLICSGLSKYFHFSLILSNLTLGMVFTNIYFSVNKKAVDSVTFISLPIYIVFFVLAGAHLQIKLLPAMGLLGIIYIICRSIGLISGAYVGAVISKADAVIRKYLGLGILSQAGVAIGLAMMAVSDLGHLGESGKELAVVVMNTVAGTTIVFEIIGPIATKFAIKRAGEIGKANV